MWSEIFDGTIGVIGNGGPRLQLQCVDSVDICRFVALVTGALVRIIAHMTSEKNLNFVGG